MKVDQIISASKEVLSSKNYLMVFVALTIAFSSVFVFIPILLIPANSLLFQLSVFIIRDYALLSTLSLLIGLMITMQVYSYKKTKQLQAGKSIIGSSSGIIAGLFGTAGCSSCLASIFGFLGAGNVFFLLEHQTYVVTASIMLILISLYFTARKINCAGVCE